MDEGPVYRFGPFRYDAGQRLVDVHTGKVIWAETYDQSSADAEAQTDVARAVAAQVGGRLERGTNR